AVRQAALAQLEATGTQLVDALVATVDAQANAPQATATDRQLQASLQALLHSSYTDTIERAKHVKPATLAQLQLSRELPHTGVAPRDAGFILGKMRIARTLLSQPAHPTPAAPNEARYCRRLHAQEGRLRAVARYGDLAADTYSNVVLTDEQ